MKARIGSAVFLLALGGCRIEPRYTRPTAAVPALFKESGTLANDATDGWRPARPADPASKGHWWEIYNDPQLNALELQADAANESLKIAEANVRAARAAIRFQRAAEAPVVSVAPGAGSIRDSVNQPYFNPSFANNGTGQLTLPIDLSWEIDLWGKIRRNVSAAQDRAQASSADLAAARLSVQAELAYDYFELRSADAEKLLLSRTVETYERALQLTRSRFEGGAAPRTDMEQAEAQLGAARVLNSDVLVRRAEYEHAIAALLGKPPAMFAIPISPISLGNPVIPPIPEILPSELLERRPDIASAEREVAAANEQIGIAKIAYYPSLSLSAAAGFTATTAANWFTWPSRFWAVGPTVSETLFEAGRRRATKEAAIATYDAEVARYRQSTLTAFQQVEDNLAVLRILSTESIWENEATSAAEEALKHFQNRYSGGVDTYLQVVTAQTTALSDQRNQIDIRRRQLDASILLIKAIGGDWNVRDLPTF